MSLTKGTLYFTIYSFKRECYKCKQSTDIITYITFADGTNEDLKYPWNKERLLKNQDILSHLEDPSIEYYGLNVIGDNENYDKLLMNKYPDKIKLEYSKTQNSKYPMNVCNNCGAKQGWYFVYRKVNELIKDMKEIEILK